MVRLILALLLISNLSYAEDSIYLNKGDSSPYSGYLLPEEEVKQLRVNTIERDLYKTTSDLKGQQVQLLTDQNIKFATALESTSSLRTWEKIGYFTAGIVIVVLAIKGAHEVYTNQNNYRFNSLNF